MLYFEDFIPPKPFSNPQIEAIVSTHVPPPKDGLSGIWGGVVGCKCLSWVCPLFMERGNRSILSSIEQYNKQTKYVSYQDQIAHCLSRSTSQSHLHPKFSKILK